MAKSKKKKYKNIKLEQTELTPVAIGMFDNRKKNSIGTFLILIIFVLAVVFLPQISEYVNNYLHPEISKPSKLPTPSKPVIPDDGDDNPDHFTAYVDNLKIETDDITVSNILVNTLTYEISYDVTNNLPQSQNIEELNYYLEVFNTERTFIERIKLAGDVTLNSGAFQNFKRTLSSDAATTIGFISIVKKTENDYPVVELKNVSDGIGTLLCTKNHEKVTYKFANEKLKEVKSEVGYLITDSDYQTYYEENKIKASTYNNKIGVSSTIFEYEGGYNITSIINLAEATRAYIFNADTFKEDTTPRVVKFEMEAQGFTCE